MLEVIVPGKCHVETDVHQITRGVQFIWNLKRTITAKDQFCLLKKQNIMQHSLSSGSVQLSLKLSEKLQIYRNLNIFKC